MELFEGLDIVNRENVHNFDVPGVWALFGKRKDRPDNRRWYCLQVAATICIKTEILKDMQLLEEKLEEDRDDSPYINQFGEILFEYPSHPTPREYLYSKYIKEQFEDFQFIVVCREKGSTKRRNIEKEFAYRTNAVYWRNGRAFNKGERIDYDNRKSLTEGFPSNGEVSTEVIIPFARKYNYQ